MPTTVQTPLSMCSDGLFRSLFVPRKYHDLPSELRQPPSVRSRIVGAANAAADPTKRPLIRRYFVRHARVSGPTCQTGRPGMTPAHSYRTCLQANWGYVRSFVVVAALALSLRGPSSMKACFFAARE
jgi:hypothetical protein